MPFDFDRSPPDPELFNCHAEAVARRLHQAPDMMNKTTQIRRFYDELVGWQERIQGDDEQFRQYEAYLRMLNAKVAYAKGRKLVDDVFHQWFSDCLRTTTSARALDHFRLHFEAVLGFLKSLRA